MADAPEQFHVKLNEGPVCILTSYSGRYDIAAAAALSLLNTDGGEDPLGGDGVHIEIWCPRILPDYGPYHYLANYNVYGNIVISHAVKREAARGLEG